MEESTVESVSRPVAFGTAMLMMFINWMIIGRPDGSPWIWVEHLAADLFVLALMGGVVVATGRLRSGWWSLLLGQRPTPQVARAAQSVRDAVALAERPHRVAAHLVGFLAAAFAFAVVAEVAEQGAVLLVAVLGAFVASQVAVLLLLRPRIDAALRQRLEAARAGLSAGEQSALSAELGLVEGQALR